MNLNHWIEGLIIFEAGCLLGVLGTLFFVLREERNDSRF